MESNLFSFFGPPRSSISAVAWAWYLHRISVFYKPAVYRSVLLVLCVHVLRSSGSAWLRCLFSGSKGSSTTKDHLHPPCRLSFPGLQGFLYTLFISSKNPKSFSLSPFRHFHIDHCLISTSDFYLFFIYFLSYFPTDSCQKQPLGKQKNYI